MWIHTAALLVAVASIAGCYRPGFVECSVRCGVGEACPDGTSCAPDGFCHAVDSIDAQCFGGDGDGDSDAGGDGDGDGDGDLDGGLPAACPAPFLVAAIESFNNEGGRVARFALGSDGTVSQCTDLTGGGFLPDQPFALAWVPPDRLAVVSRDGIDLLDADDDSTVWSTGFSSTVVPVDALLVDEGGDTRLAVGLFNPQTTNDIDPLELYDLTTGQLVDSIDTGVATRSVARNPRDPSVLLRLKPSSFAAAEFNPFTGELFQNPAYVREPSDSFLKSVHALFSTPARIAWVGTRPSQDTDGVYYFNDPDMGTDDNVPLGPIRCDAEDRQYLHAIPDPTLNTRFIALTQLGGARQIVRFTSTGGGCVELFDGATLGPNRRISRLAVVESVAP